MSGVDDRVVKLTFDNASFQKNTSDTMSTLDKLKSNLNFSNSTDSTNQLSAAFRNFNLNPLSTSVEAVSSKFLILATVAITALANITNKAVDAGAQIIKALTITPIVDGYKEYETNINSIQTILANTSTKGTNITQVNDALDELNRYADKTIYNFSEMAKNIGTFTAAGVDLDTSVRSIKGIANLAAISGSSSQQASNAMYQLSQAIASGTVRLQDWISVNNANMGGEVFQNSLFETGKALGTLVDVPMDQTFGEWKDAGNLFRESLKDGWLTSEVLTTTLGGLSGEMDAASLSAAGYSDEQVVAIQKMADTAVAAATEVKTATQLVSVIKEAIGSGWASTFRIIIGDFIEAKGLFSGIAAGITGPIESITTARNDLLSAWKFLGGRDIMLQGFLYALAAIKLVIRPIIDAFRAIFPRKTAQELVSMTEGFRDFAKGLMISEDGASKLQSVFQGIFSIFKIGIEVVKGIFGVFINLGKVLFSIIGGFSGGAAGVGGFVTKIQQLLVESGGIEKFFAVINSGIQKIPEFMSKAQQELAPFFDKLKEGFAKVAEFAEKAKDKIAGVFGGDGGGGGGGIPGAGIIASTIERIREVFSGIGGAASSVGNSLGGFGSKVAGFFTTVAESGTKIGSAIITLFKDVLSGIGGGLDSGFFMNLMKSVGAGALAGIAVALLKFAKDGFKLDLGFSDAIQGLIDVFSQLKKNLKAMQREVQATTLLKIAAAVGILAVSLLVLSGIDGAKLAQALGSLAGGMLALVGSIALLDKVESDPAKMLALSVSLIFIAAAAVLLSIGLARLSKMSWAEIGKGLVGLVGILAVMAGASAAFSKVNGSFIRTGLSLIILSAAIWVFSKVISSISKIPYKDLGKGLSFVAVSLGIIALFANLVDSKELNKISFGFLIFSISLGVLQKVIKAFAEIKTSELIRGLAGMALTMGVLIISLKSLPDNNELMAKAAGIVILSVALYIMSEAIKSMGALSWEELAKGILGLGIVLFGLVIAAKLMTGAVAGAAAMVVMAGALFILGNVIKSIAELSWGDLIKGLVGIAAVLLILGLAALLMKPILLPLMGLGVALILVGIGFAAFGLGAMLVAKAFMLIADAGKKGIDTIINILNTLIMALPGFIESFAKGIVRMIKTFLDSGSELIDGFGNIIVSILDKIIEIAPKIAEAFGAIGSLMITYLREKIPEFITLGFEILVAFMQGLSNNIELIVTLALEIIANFMAGITAGIPALAIAATDLIVAFITAIGANIQRVIDAGADLIVKIIQGISDNIEKIVVAVGELIVKFLNAIANQAEPIIAAGFGILENILTGLGSGAVNIIKTVGGIIGGIILQLFIEGNKLIDEGIRLTKLFLSGMVDKTIDFAFFMGELILELLVGLKAAVDTYADSIRIASLELGVAIIDGMTGGMATKAQEAYDKIKEIAGKVIGFAKGIFQENSPSKVFIKIGKGVVGGLAIGLNNDAEVVKASENLANGTISGFKEALNKAAKGMESSPDFTPKIRPVLDLSNVQKDAKSISSLFDSNSISTIESFGRANAISRMQVQSESTKQSAQQGPMEIKFEQNNYSPAALSASDIYRSTKSQIVLAKEELGVR